MIFFTASDESKQDDHLRAIDQFITSLESSLWSLSSFLHANPELAYEEHKAHDALTQFMASREGWHITRSAYGMPTAWEAVYDTGRPGPAVSFNAEMDALPNLGHACGHNLIAVVSVAAGLATAERLRRSSHHLGGRVVVLGTPAEEGGAGGKIKCLAAGAFAHVDVSLISHPGIYNNSTLVRTTAFAHLDVAYHGRAAHAARSPWLGINALDALVVAYNAVSVLRQQTRPDDVVGLQITHGGDRPNVVHERAAGVAVLRAGTASRLDELRRKVVACFEAGAQATGADVQIDCVPGYMDHVPNAVLAASCARHWEALPGPRLDPPLLPPLPGMPPTMVKASTDQGNVSHVVPSLNVSFAIPPAAIAAHEDEHKQPGPPHTPAFEKASGTRAAFERAMRVAKAMAATAVDVYTVPGLLDDIREQWRRDMHDAET